jgi:transcriptional regulator with XRE-family HTH domain
MPRRREPDPLAAIVGLRIRHLREELGLTMEKLAFESELGSKGHLSNIERGLARPNIQTLKVLADRLGLKLLDLVTFPDEDDRQRLVDCTRRVARGPLRKILNDLGDQGSKRRRGGARGPQAVASAATKLAPAAETGTSKRRKAGKTAAATAPIPSVVSTRRGAKARQGAAASPAEVASPAAAKRARKAKPAR